MKIIKRIIAGIWTMIVYACVATVVAEAVLAFYLLSTWKIDGKRWLRMVAAAQGIEMNEGTQQAAKPVEKSTEQPSFEQILEARALKYRNLELRERELRGGVAQLQIQENKLADERNHYKKLYDSFNTQLASMSEGSVAEGKEDVRRTLETVKPKQAKQLIQEMLDNKGMNDVVAMLKQMPDAKRAKIIGEFKSPDELDQISDVLRRIREGEPSASVTENTRKQLDQPAIQQR